ncbi:membrane protein [Bacteroidia bacterium]|nr:membrane protein [Bacteroidia bacterium]
MKKYIIVLLVSVTGLTGTSCNDWLDLEPDNKVVVKEGTGIGSLSEANGRLNALYAMLRAYELYGARMTYYGDALGEDMMSRSGTMRTANYYTFRFTEDNAPRTFWDKYYEVINNVNTLLAGIDGLTGLSTADEVTRKDYKGQALTIRALAYFDLTRLYGYPYQKDNGASLGVPIVDKPVDANYKPTRNTVAECYTFFIKDFTDAVPLLKDAKISGKFNKWTAMHLLSRAYLYKGDDTNALATAKEAITGAEGKGYKLWTAEEYGAAATWAKEFDPEVLWELPITSTETAGGNENIGYLTYAAGYDDIYVSDDWRITLMGDQTDDIRYKNLIDGGSGKSGVRYLWKHVPNSGETNRGHSNVKVLRLSELYLIAAEAAARSNNNDDAMKYLEPIVTRGDATQTVEGTTVTLDRVLEERRKELVGEGHRFFDAIRNGKHITRTQGLPFPHLALILPEAWDFDWTYYKVVLPIPISEINANKNIAGQQNPGY